MIYSSKQNSLIKMLASLKDKKGRRENGLYIAQGVKMVSEAIKFNQEIEYIVIAEGFDASFLDCNAKTITVTNQVFEYLSDEKTPQGVLAVIKIPEFTANKPNGNAIVLDGIQDPGNLGTIIRTAVASGYSDIYLINSVDPFSPKVVKASMSGIYFVNLYKCTYDELFQVIDGYDLIVSDLDGDNLFEFKPKNNYAIVIGNEGNGVSNELREKASVVLTIPMTDKIESLNASVAAALMMYNLKN
ncbi:MAG: RNA methyltransferase [Clostridiales bacterium]|nr:RNA methyltransferase [Clostridiales bacterium]